MPFKPPFKEKFDVGDLVYGLGGPRKDLMTKLGLDGPNSRTVDLSTINNYATTGPEKDTLDSKLQYARGWDDLQRKAAREEIERFNKKLGEHGKYHSAVDWKPGKLDKQTEARLENQAWRRKCKGGLYYVCFVQCAHVHFCLEGMNFKQVVEKSFVDQSTPIDVKDQNGKFRAITNAELRWIYRNREHSEVEERVQFWKRDGGWVACEPPWVSEASLWSQYVPSRQHNVHGKLE